MIKPVGKTVIIKLIEKKQDSGIVLPDNVRIDKEIVAEVVSVSDDCERGVKPGHEVLLRVGAESSAVPVPKQEKQLALPENFIIAIMNHEE